MLRKDHSNQSDLSMLSLPDLSSPEVKVIPLMCWQDVCLSKIWIPRHLLTSRKKPLNTWGNQGVFHTLEKRGDERKIESFSVYSDSDSDSETDVFQSDSDDAFDLDSISTEKMKTKDDSAEVLEKIDNVSKLESLPVKSNVSLNEILNSTTEVDISNFEFKKPHIHTEPVNKEIETLQLNKRNKNAKKKNKFVKSVTLDKFLEDYTEEDRQEDYANDYFQKVLKSQSKDCVNDTKVKLNNFEFPELTTKEIKFIKNEKKTVKEPEITIKEITEILSQSDTNENICAIQAKKEVSTSKNAVGKFVIENIPSEVSHEDLFSLLCGYGEVKDFSLEQDGDFQKAFVKIDLICDIDWIVDCLNGTEPFGASSRVLKCYKQ